jgi:hypothetical protein
MGRISKYAMPLIFDEITRLELKRSTIDGEKPRDYDLAHILIPPGPTGLRFVD